MPVKQTSGESEVPMKESSACDFGVTKKTMGDGGDKHNAKGAVLVID